LLLLAFLPSRLGAQDVGFVADPPSGTYAGETVLHLSASGSPVRYAFRTTSGGWGPWIPYREPILLSAVAGEERSYSILVTAGTERRELRYRIDRRPPSLPVPDPLPGRLFRRVELSFHPAASQRVIWAMEGPSAPQGGVWDGKPIPLGHDGELETVILRAYATDEAGNHGAIGEYRYDMDLRPAILDLQSPVTGTFANAQPLYVSFRNVTWIRYSLDGSDPAVSGIPYRGPTQIAPADRTTVKVAALARNGAMLRAEAVVCIKPDTEKPLSLSMGNGAYASGFILSFPQRAGSRLRYTAAERTPDSNDPTPPSALAFETSPSIRHSVTIRLKDIAATGAEYRWFYVLDGKPVPTPRIRLREDSSIEAWASEDSLLLFSIDGKDPNGHSEFLTAPYPLPSDGKELDFRVAAMGPASSLSATAALQVPVAAASTLQAALFTPGPEAGGTVSVSLPESAPKHVVYELSAEGVEPPEPSSLSPRFPGRIELSLPHGTERSFRIRFASLDEWGRVARLMDTQIVHIDREPPQPPACRTFPEGTRFENPTVIQAEAEGEVRVEVVSNGSMPTEPTPESPVMEKKGLSLEGRDGESVTYRMRLACRDAWGNASEPSDPYAFTVDRRVPECPEILGVSDGGRYGDSVVGLKTSASPWSIRFTFGSGSTEPPDPNADSPLLTDSLFFSGDADTETPFCVKLVPFSHDGKRRGAMRTARFVIDRKPPEVPELAGFSDEAVFSSAVVLRVDRIPADTRVSLAVTGAGQKAVEPFGPAALYSGPVTVDVPQGAAQDYMARVMAEDSVGNRSPIERTYRFRIDREPPADPELSTLADGSISSRPVTAAFSVEAARIVYEISDDGSFPYVPSSASMAYTAPLQLAGKADSRLTYRIRPRGIDEAGNMSPAAKIYTLTVDRTQPALPGEPVAVPFGNDGGSLLVRWDVAEGSILYWRRVPSADAAFQLYSAPVTIPVVPGGETVRLEAYATNSAGTRSGTAEFSIPAPRKLPAPSFTGVPQGGTSNTGLRIGLRGAEGSLRYEVAADGGFPVEVKTGSAQYAEPFVLDATDGETVVYLLSARAFGNNPNELPSDETRVRIILDRTPPAPPVVEGIEDGAHYQDPQRAVLRADEGRIFWTLSEGGIASFQPYASPVLLGAVDGRIDNYRLRAYTVDAAGNRSREVREWSVSMDRRTIYVDAAGNDNDDGTWGRPVHSLVRALEISRLTGRTAIFAAAGYLPVEAPIAITTGVTILGGLDPATWKPKVPAARTILAPDARLMRGRTTLTMRGGSLQASGLEFRGHAGSGTSFLEVVDGEAQLSNSAFLMEDVEDGTAVRLTGGKLSLTGCRLEASRVARGALLSGRAQILLEDTSLSGPDPSGEFRVVDLSPGAAFTMKGGAVRSGSGQEPVTFFAERADISLSGVSLNAGRGSQRSVCLDLRDCRTGLSECAIGMDPQSSSSVTVSANGGSLALKACRVEVAASVGATGILLKACEAVIDGCILRALPSSEYLYLLHQSGGRVRLWNNVLLGDSSGDSACLYRAEGETDLFNNTLIAGTGRGTTAAVILGGSSMARIVNNILVRREGQKGTALELIGTSMPASLSILTNDFSGWESILVMGPAAGTSVRRTARTVAQMESMLTSLERATASGNIVETFWKTFAVTKSEEYPLAPDSLCRDAGTDLRDPRFAGPAQDIQGKKRPASIRGRKEAYDIGAEEAAGD